MIDMSREPNKNVDRLARVRGLPRPVELAHGAEIVEATKRGLATPVTEQPESRTIEETPTDKHRADALWAVLQCLCIGQKIDPDLVASRQDIGRLYRQLVANKEPKGLRMLTGWRREAVTQTVLEMMKGKAQI